MSEIELKSKIQQHQNQQQALHAEARKVTGDARHALNQERKAGKYWGRILYLAYAMLRGVPYKKLEANAATPPPFISAAETVGWSEEQADAWVREATHPCAA